jgi:hypothetical protein
MGDNKEFFDLPKNKISMKSKEKKFQTLTCPSFSHNEGQKIK